MHNRQALLTELESVDGELADLHTSLGQLLKTEHEGRVRSYFETEATTDAARNKMGQLNTLDVTGDIFEERAAIAALEARRDYLHTALAHGG